MRIKLTLAYDGTHFCGWQRQDNGRTVQGEVESALERLTGKRCKVTASGRTDAGVHAEGQTAHFDSDFPVPADKFFRALNPYLPQDVKALASERVQDNFNACTGAKRKTYVYTLYYSDEQNPLKERYSARVFPAPDLQAMVKAAQAFLGEHDFKGFRATGGGVKTTVRTIYDIEIIPLKGGASISVCGNGFLYNMVRIMVGAIVAVGQGKLAPEEISAALITGERPKSIKTMPAAGLCLSEVEYV